MPSLRQLAIAAACVIGLTGAAGCASDSATGTDLPPAAMKGTITITDGSFGEKLTVAPKAEITVQNDDTEVHSLGGDGITVDDIQPGESATFTAPEKEGTYLFTCGHHPQMAGALVVSMSGPTPDPTYDETAGP